MAYVKVGQENSAAIEVSYEDHGTGRPVVMIHGYPLDGRSWEKQELALLDAGCRVITYDRRGFGASGRPATGYDYDTLAADLDRLLTVLDLRNAALVGFSMGTGEIVRYLARYGSARISRAVLFAPLGPYLRKTPDNPDGMDASVFEEMARACAADRPAFLKDFLDVLYDVDVHRGTRVSDQAWQASWNTAVTASARAARDCIGAWLTDFRPDLPAVDVPTLVVQGSEDRVLPPEASGDRLAGLITGMKHVVVAGGPHAVCWTHPAECNAALLDFLGR
ncbi:non-heme chloroperoxidase [Streptomyces sp. DvalAA-14]|uniref:alpha/beta fold hydrolase n=1 Tax=unclassified Streptomyces TaxID=2593676 RepID=UPI00081AF5BD|nr:MULTISPECIES: alpha/beta hydrolase [unclassified Streptomyces]MYS24511.1 alpha/beta fold hydrolase [Streptomyces sp. SID4948]SCE46720.1 non-heme chloroperoxidase [Streptomyces sp. DvalAA-14]